MGLLGDQHRRARVPLAADDEQLERVIIDGAPVEFNLAGIRSPVLGGDRRQFVEAAELAERPLGGAEQIAHHVLDRSGEQDRDRRGVLQHGAQLTGDRVRVAVGLAWRGEFLELVQEQDQPLPSAAGDSLQQLKRVSSARSGGTSPTRRERELDRVASSCFKRTVAVIAATCRARAAPGAPGEQLADLRPVRERLDRQRLGELQRVRLLEQIHGDRVRAAWRQISSAARATLVLPNRRGPASRR